MISRKAGGQFALVLIWALISFCLLAVTLGIPILSQQLADGHVEYTHQQTLIQTLLTTLVSTCLTVLVLLLVLMRRVITKTLLHTKSLALAKSLGIAFLGVGLALLLIFQWLTMQNTMPPLVAFCLLAFILFTVLASVVTFSLVSVLSEAILARLELESVI